MMEIDLPRMQSLSPQFDSPSMDTIPGMTTLTDIQSSMGSEPQPEPDPSNCSIKANNCEWKFDSEICGCKYTNKSGCGCKYINKVSVLVSHEVFLNTKKNYAIEFTIKLFENNDININSITNSD